VSWAIWITGPPGSGKSTIARAVEAALRARGRPVARLELDEIRKAITPEPRYSDDEREVVYRALAHLAGQLVRWGTPVLVDATAHRRRWRDGLRGAVARFAEVQLDCPLQVRRDRERARPRGHAPPGIYARAGRPGATVPGVDVPYEPALAPELAIDTSAEPVAESVARIVELTERLEPAPPAASARADAGAEPGWAIWITGRPGGDTSELARRVAERLQARGARASVLASGSVETELLAGRPAGAAEHDIVDRVVAYAAKLLTEAGVSVIVDAPASRKASRQVARGMIPAFAEIRLVGAAATRPGQEGEPDVTADDVESADAELAIRADDGDVERVAEQVLLVIQRLAATGSGARRRSADGPGQRGSRGDGGGPA
jgi:adenylylsulfate kinase